MNLKVGKKFSFASAAFDSVLTEELIRQEKEMTETLLQAYQKDVETAIRLRLDDLGVRVQDLSKGAIRQVFALMSTYSEFYFGNVLLFRLHSNPDLVRFGGWHIEYPDRK